MKTTQLLVIGFDGLDHNLIHKYQSDMPNLSRLLSGGIMTRMSSTHPPITPGAWATICSGVNPGKTGILGFFLRRGYSFTPVALHCLQAKGLWDYCAEQGVSCGIVNVPWPGPLPESAIFGVTGRFTSLATSPPELKERILRMGYRPEVFHPSEFSSLRGFLRFAFEQANACTRVTVHLVESFRPEICMVVYNLPDMALHAMLNERLIQKIYQEIDRNLGELLPYAERHVVVSDHGVNITWGPVFYFGEWLVREGYLKLGAEPHARRAREHVGFFLRRILQRSGLSDVKKMIPQWLRNLLPPGIRYLASLPVDYAQSQAFLGPGDYCDVFLNIQGREPEGTVPLDAAESLLARMASRLADVSFSDRHRPIRLSPSREIYHGDLLDQLPDAVVRDFGSWHLEPGLYANGPLGPVDLKPQHNQEGVFLFSGPALPNARSLQESALVDVLPTSLALAGLKIPEGLDGDCLLEACGYSAPAFYKTELTHAREEIQASFTGQEEAEVMERLKKLGYL